MRIFAFLLMIFAGTASAVLPGDFVCGATHPSPFSGKERRESKIIMYSGGYLSILNRDIQRHEESGWTVQSLTPEYDLIWVHYCFTGSDPEHEQEIIE